MKKIILLLITFLSSYASVYSQCTPSATPVLCSDPANNVFFVDPTADVEIVFDDATGTPISGIVWSPKTFLYVTAGQAGVYPGTFPNPMPSIYFNGSSHNDPANNPNPIGGALANTTYTYNYTLPSASGCTPTNGQIKIVTGGFTYDDYCRGDTTTLDDLPLLNYNTAGGLNWYSDAAGSVSISNTTQIQGGQTYYVDLGIAGCNEVFPVVVEYGAPMPTADTIQNFCTQATWQAAGFSNPTDDLSSVIVCGSNLQWYSDAAGTMPINNLSAVSLSDGDTYYVSQSINGCESELLAVNLLENECACIENPSFQDESGNIDLDGYTFFSQNFGTISACQGMNYLAGTPQYTNTIQQYNYTSNNRAVTYATPGNIPWLAANGINITSTSPFGCSNRSIKLNDDNGGGKTGTTMVKEFIAGEVFTLDFMFLMNDPGHAPDDQPFVTFRLYDDAGTLIQERCITANPENCIFNEISNPSSPDGGSSFTPLVYTEWSCIKLNTIELQGQAARLEITTGDCDLSGHWGTAYYDNFYVGDDSPGLCNSAFGYMAVDPIVDANSGGYEACSLFSQPVNPNCAPALATSNPTFPIEICGAYTNPTGGIPSTIDINVVDENGNIVYTPNTFTSPGGPGTYCITINQGDIPDPYGNFTIEGEMVFDMNCGSPYQYNVQAQSNGFKFCPTAGCPAPMLECSGGTGPPPSFDLTLREPDVLSNVTTPANYEITYYNTEAGAQTQDATDEITTPGNYITPTTQTVYVRLDYDYGAIGISPVSDCYDVVALDVIVGQAPTVPATVNDIEVCDEELPAPGQTVDLTVREADIMVNATPGTDVVTYYDSRANAELANGTGEITSPSGFQTTTTQSVYVRVESPDGCFSISTFDVVIVPLPTYNVPSDYSLCDEDGVEDGFTDFDFTVSTTQIEGTNTNLDITYYETAAEADGGLAADQLGSPYTNTTADSQTIYVRIEDTTTNCYEVEPLLLEVIAVPTATTPATYELCDTNGDNQEQFDLSTLDNMINNDPNVTVTYHANQNDADAGTPTLPVLYTSPTATIFVRVEDNAGAGCYNTTTADLQVNPGPDVPNPLPTLEVCDDDTDGIATFNLQDNEATILSNESNTANFDVTYYADAADLANGNAIANETAYDNTTPNTQTIFVLVENLTTGCTTEAQFNIEVNPLPTYNTPTDYTLCDQGTQDGFTPFDFTVSTAQIEGTNTNLTITYYETAPEAGGGLVADQLGSPYTNTTANTQTIQVRIEDATTGCYVVEPLLLEVIPAPTVTTPAVYELCDSGNGQAEFDLSTLDTSINNDPNVTITYHATQNDADLGTPTLPVLYNSTTTTIFARVEDNNPPGCYNTTPVDLQVNPAPAVPNSLPTLELCDDDTDGIATFNLQDNEATILSNESSPANFDVTYYADATDLANGNAIANETSYDNTTPNTQTIFVLVENLTTGCTTEAQFDIEVNPLPSFNTPQTLATCDDAASDGVAQFDLSDATTQITGNNPNLNVSYYDTQAEADAGDPSTQLPTLYTNTGSPYNETIYVRIRNVNTDCYTTASLDLEVNQAPSAIEPQPLVYCDDDNDGFGSFDLSSLDSEINNDPNVTITYHETQANAENDVLPLSSPFNNTVVNTQTIFVRVESPGVACYNTTTAELIVEQSPQPVQNLPALTACDPDGDGVAIFDLTQQEPAILANEANPGDFTVRYYPSQTDADNDTNEISVPGAYANDPSINPQTIYVVVEGSNTCTKQTSFELQVNPLPAITTPQQLELCDYNNPGDEQEAFNLEDATLDITQGDKTIDITYHETQADADSGSNPLTSPYTNTVNNQTIYIRAEDEDTGCTVTQGYTLTLIVNPLPSPQVPSEPVEVCDTDNDGFEEFDLEEQVDIILNTEPDVSITFHLTQANAEAGSNAIDTSQPFGLSSANNQILYVRAENDLTGCYVVEALELEVVPTPEIIDLEDLYVCDDDTPNGLAVFDLTINTPNALGNQVPTDLLVTYHESQADAEAGVNAIVNPSSYTNTSNGQLIYVRLENTETGCIDTFDFTDDNSFSLNVEPLPVVNEPSVLKVCDDDYTTTPVSQTIFDLTQKEAEIAGATPAPGNYEFSYYESIADQNNDNPITEPENYQNIANPQTIYVTVVNTQTQGMCEDYTTITLEVLPLPSPSETDLEALRQVACDDDNDGVAADPFDLTQSGQLISAGENVDITYYKTEFAAEEGDETVAEFIGTPTAYVNEPSFNEQNNDGLTVQVIYARVDSGVNGNFCYVIVPFELQVVPAPELNPAGDPLFGYTLCEDGTSGEAAVNFDDITENLYDATNGDPSTIIPLLDPNANQDQNIDNYTVTYHLLEQQAKDGVAPLPNGYVAEDGDRFYIRVEYADTGCYNTDAIGVVEITVEPRPSIVNTPIEEDLCSDEPGGSTATLDLTQYNGQINPGSPQGTAVVYYADQTAYENGEAIQDPSFYTTVSNPQTIIAETINTTTLCESPSVAEITIEVNDRPEVDISNYDGMIICEDSNPLTPVEGGNYEPIVIETGLNGNDYSFVWTFNGSTLAEDGPSLSVDEPGTYEVTVTDQDGNIACSTTSSATFIQNNPPEFKVSALTLSFEEEHAILVSNVTGSGDYEFRLDNGPWQSLGDSGTLTFDGVEPGEHLIYGRDAGGCGITLATISFIDYPKFFTPNQDGYNDTWNIIGLQDQPQAKVFIFDRYGKLLKQLSPAGEGWDGTYNGSPVPSNDYWFRVEYMETMPDGSQQPREFKANFTLKR